MNTPETLDKKQLNPDNSKTPKQTDKSDTSANTTKISATSEKPEQYKKPKMI